MDDSRTPLAAADQLETLGNPLTYTPDEYRWVPVRRRPRYDGWTEEKQRRFIEVLADTGLVNAAAGAVGMTRESAYRLRRSGHAAAFARAWDAARHHAGSVIEDIAFERAIEGVPVNVYDEHGTAIAVKQVYNDRLLTFLLTHLKPERYARAALSSPEAAPDTVDAVLAQLEPKLPAPVEDMLDAETLGDELVLADIGDGAVPHFLSEQRPARSEEQLKAEAFDARMARGKAASDRMDAGEKLDEQAFADYCFYLDPVGGSQASNKRFR